MKPLKMIIFVNLLMLLYSVALTTSQPAFSVRHWSCGITRVVNDIVRNHFPECEIILLYDKYFVSHMNSWITNFTFPYYSVSLGDIKYPEALTHNKRIKTSGFLCTTLVVCCLTFESCRHSDRVNLYRKLFDHGILLKERRTVLYINELKVTKGKKFDLNEDDNSDSSDEVVAHRSGQKVSHHTGKESVYIMQQATELFKSLRSHITIVLDANKNNIQTSSASSLFYCKTQNNETFYETITFSPNWLAGGTPVLRNTWSSKTKFRHSSSSSKEKDAVMLTLSHLRFGGTAKFCVTSNHMLPYINVRRDGYIQGFDAELINIFQRRFGLKLEIFEADDRDFGRINGCGRWTGTIGHVIRKEADFGMGQITFTRQRFKSGLKFSPVVTTSNGVAVCPIPKFAPRFKILFHPFEETVWVYIIGLFAFAVGMIDVLQRLAIKLKIHSLNCQSNSFQNQRKKLKVLKVSGTRYSTKNISARIPWIQSVGSIFQRSISINRLPRNWATLIIFFIWLFATYFSAAVYITILISVLSFPPRDPYVTSPADVLNKKSTWSVSPLVAQAIQNSTIESEIRLYTGAKYTSYVNRTPGRTGHIFRLANITQTCIVAEKNRATYVIDQNFTVIKNKHPFPLFYVSKGSFFMGAIGWAMREDLDFLIETYFDQMFLYLSGFGFDLKIVRDRQPHTVRYSFDTIQDFRPLDYRTVRIIFHIGLYGLILSFLVFVGEIIWHKALIFFSHLHVQIIYAPPNAREEDETGHLALIW